MFSIIIPVYNNFKLLSNVLAGLCVQQSFNEPFEVILVDNNSTEDGLYSIYQFFIDKLELSLINQPRLRSTFSLCRARNIGISIAKYPWLIFLDSDCIPNKNYLSALHEQIKKSPNNVCLVGIRKFIEGTTLTPDIIFKSSTVLENTPLIKSSANYHLLEDRRLGKIESLPNTEHPWGHFYGCNMVFHQKDVMQAGKFNEKYDGIWGFEDIEFSHRIIDKLKINPIYVSQAFVYHQEGENPKASNSHRTSKKNNKNYQRICASIPGYFTFSQKEYLRFGLTKG